MSLDGPQQGQSQPSTPLTERDGVLNHPRSIQVGRGA